ncbi:MAG: hypothetical protein ACJAVJ_001117, partial [Planctomycetota bacterium]
MEESLGDGPQSLNTSLSFLAVRVPESCCWLRRRAPNIPTQAKRPNQPHAKPPPNHREDTAKTPRRHREDTAKTNQAPSLSPIPQPLTQTEGVALGE